MKPQPPPYPPLLLFFFVCAVNCLHKVEVVTQFPATLPEWGASCSGTGATGNQKNVEKVLCNGKTLTNVTAQPTRTPSTLIFQSEIFVLSAQKQNLGCGPEGLVQERSLTNEASFMLCRGRFYLNVFFSTTLCLISWSPIRRT